MDYIANWRKEVTSLVGMGTKQTNQGHPTDLFGEYLFGTPTNIAYGLIFGLKSDEKLRIFLAQIFVIRESNER